MTPEDLSYLMYELKINIAFLFFPFRNFQLYLTTNTDLFTDNFKAVFVNQNGEEEKYDVHLQNYFTGHVVGELMEAFLLSPTLRGTVFLRGKIMVFFFR